MQEYKDRKITTNTNKMLMESSVYDLDLNELEQQITNMSHNDTYLGPVEKIGGKLKHPDEYNFTSSLSSSSTLVCTKLWYVFVHNSLSQCNNLINNMSNDFMRQCLYDHGLNQLGSMIILKRRMQEFLRRVRDCQSMGYGPLDISQFCNPISKGKNVLGESNIDQIPNLKKPLNNSLIEFSEPVILRPTTFYSYFLIIDLEATCDKTDIDLKPSLSKTYEHEIIEFPILLYDTKLCRCVNVFHAYCRPTIHPNLSHFCQDLTHIKQSDVDKAQPFVTVLQKIEQWLFKVHNLTQINCAIVCDCNADMSKFMRIQCQLCNIRMPCWTNNWINLSKTFRLFYKVSCGRLNLNSMLNYLNLKFFGQQHRGFDDAWNILRVVRTLHIDGCLLRVNEQIALNYPPKFVISVSKLMAESAFGPMGCKLKFAKKIFHKSNNGQKSDESFGSDSSNGSSQNRENRFNKLENLDEAQKESLLWLAHLKKSRISNG